MDSTTAIQQNTSCAKKFISLICLRPPYLQVCLPRRLHLLACVTSCLSHYLPVCISVCPPASAPLLRPQRDLISFSREKTEETMVLLQSSAGLPAWLSYATIQYNTIYYPHGVFYIPSFSFLTALSFTPLSPKPPVVLPVYRQAGRLAEGCCPPAKANS